LVTKAPVAPIQALRILLVRTFPGWGRHFTMT
jgi:hypothetical protein